MSPDREMAEIDLIGEWDRERILSAGPIDIKTHPFYPERPRVSQPINMIHPRNRVFSSR